MPLARTALFLIYFSSDLCFFYVLSGLPYFNPGYELIMSRSAYASSLRILGGVYKTKSQASVGGSVSANQEGEGESAINPGVEPVLENRETENAARDVPDSPPRLCFEEEEECWEEISAA